MQKRLFLLFFTLMLVPAILVMLVDWNSSERQLEILDSPGLHQALDSSLELARVVLVQQKFLTQQLADSLASVPNLEVETGAVTSATSLPGTVWWVTSDQTFGIGEDNTTAGKESRHFGQQPQELWPDFGSTPKPAPLRRKMQQGSYVFAAAPLPKAADRWLIAARPLSDELSESLKAVAYGGTGVRQLKLYYGRLLRSRGLLTLGTMTILLLLVSLWLSARLSGRIAQPLQKLVQGTEKVAGGDLTHRVEVEAPDELGDLVTAFNRMTTRLFKSQRDLRQAERLAAWQGVARRLAHEIKNPLTPINLAMHRIGTLSTDSTVADCVETVLEETTNLERLANEFSLYAKLPDPERRPLTRDQLRDLIAGQARFYLARTRVQYRWVGWDCDFTICVDEGQLRQVLSNIIKNGTEAMAGEGTLTFALETFSRLDPSSEQSAGPHDAVTLKIQDTGPGLPGEPEQVFEPYVTSKVTGTGLGLAIARRIITDNGGRLSCTSSPEGATFIIELPTAKG